jgi:hypothetical protein
MANCFRLPVAGFRRQLEVIAFLLHVVLFAQSLLALLRVISMNGVLPVAFFSQVAVTCSTNGL